MLVDEVWALRQTVFDPYRSTCYSSNEQQRFDTTGDIYEGARDPVI